MQDPAIKLFGRQITLPSTDLSTDSGVDSNGNQHLQEQDEGDDDGEEIDKVPSYKELLLTSRNQGCKLILFHQNQVKYSF